jgi:hypothetical protein
MVDISFAAILRRRFAFVLRIVQSVYLNYFISNLAGQVAEKVHKWDITEQFVDHGLIEFEN